MQERKEVSHKMQLADKDSEVTLAQMLLLVKEELLSLLILQQR